MTALGRYARLEAEARHFDGQSARPREVVLAFGKRSLVIIGPGGRIDHWPLASLRALNARGDAGLELAPEPGSDERLVLSDAEMVSAIRRVCPDLYRRPADRRGLRRALLLGVSAVAAVLVLVFAVIPQLAGQLALMIPPEREMALGDRVAGQLRDLLAWVGEGDEPPGYCAAPEGLEALAAMTGRLDAGRGLPYPLRVAVLDHGLLNAVALPGGRILVFRGLIEAAESPEEVAGVLAHEIGHVVHRDPTRNVLRSAGTAGILGLVLGDVFGATLAVAAGEAALNASYQREAERAADETAYRLMQQADLPLAPFARFFERLAEKHGDMTEGTPLRYFASHPGLAGRAERAAAADRVGEGPFEPVLDAGGWAALRGICGETAESLP